jgi:hypothetical protein
MFLKIGTIVAIIGVALSLILSLIQQATFLIGLRSQMAFMIRGWISIVESFVFDISLLVFLVAFLLSLKSAPRAA